MHRIRGFIGSLTVLRDAAQSLFGASVVPLDQGFGFMPLDDELESDDGEGDPPDSDASPQVGCLTQREADWAASIAAETPIAYVETDYYGGMGTQHAAVWREGLLIEVPLGDDAPGPVAVSDRPINAVLHNLGVVCHAGDAFDELGLGRHRSNGAWRQAIASIEPSELAIHLASDALVVPDLPRSDLVDSLRRALLETMVARDLAHSERSKTETLAGASVNGAIQPFAELLEIKASAVAPNEKLDRIDALIRWARAAGSFHEWLGLCDLVWPGVRQLDQKPVSPHTV